VGKDLKGKELGVGISQQSDKLYVARFTDKFGIRKTKRFKKLNAGNGLQMQVISANIVI